MQIRSALDLLREARVAAVAGRVVGVEEGLDARDAQLVPPRISSSWSSALTSYFSEYALSLSPADGSSEVSAAHPLASRAVATVAAAMLKKFAVR